VVAAFEIAAFGIAVVEVYFAILEFQMLVQAFPDLKKKKREPVKARNLTPHFVLGSPST